MKKVGKVLLAVAVCGLCFLAGWRLMPKVWPTIKENVVYALLPALQPTPRPTAVPYHPTGNATLEDTLGETDTVIYYFYKDYCPYCKQIEPLTSNLPQTIALPDGRESSVKLIPVDKMAKEELVLAAYAEWAVPEERQFVPAIQIGNRYLLGTDEIMAQLYEALLNGEGVDTPLLNGAERAK